MSLLQIGHKGSKDDIEGASCVTYSLVKFQQYSFNVTNTQQQNSFGLVKLTRLVQKYPHSWGMLVVLYCTQ